MFNGLMFLSPTQGFRENCLFLFTLLVTLFAFWTLSFYTAKMIVNPLAVRIFVLVGIFFGNSLACEILSTSQAISFVFKETSIDHEPGTKLPGELKVVKKRKEGIYVAPRSGDSAVAKYIRAEVDEQNERIEFYLSDNKTLREYVYEKWTPDLEFEFQLSCSTGGPGQTYTYLLVIQDENSFVPEFIDESYQAELVFSRLNGYKIQYKNNEWIQVVDIDFNKKHANVTVSCENSEFCQYFNFVPKSATLKFDKGHRFNIEVTPTNLENLNSVLEDGKTMTMFLSASDGDPNHKSALVQYDVLTVLEDDLNFEGSTGKGSVLTWAISGGVVLVILLSCSGAVAYLTMRSRKAKDLLRKLTEAEIREFLEGNVSLGVGERTRSVDVNTPIMALPYNRNFEIPREKLRIDETTILGTGAFGIVWKGSIVYSNEDSITVAVKTVKRNVGILYFKALLSELKIMAYIGKHPNIVSLVGACTHNIRKREVYIAVQYCANGNFHNYLKCRRDRFSNLVVDGNVQLTNSAAYSYMYSNRGCFSKTISTMDLLKWSTQIANGLQYLESLGVIHGDLATRNILLDSERMAKIGDFGLSRRLIDYSNYSNLYYTKTSQAPLPWKWMSPESLKDMRFSKKSDIWSLGIVLWEVFTLGQTPYPGLNWDETFVERLEKGMRPAHPAFAPNLVYDIMVDCWHLDAHDRPAILDIKRALENITSSALRQKGDMSYMRFHGDTAILRMIQEDEQGYLQPDNPNRKNYVDL